MKNLVIILILLISINAQDETVNGKLTVNGISGRPITIGNLGSIGIQGDAGGWAFGLNASGSNGTNLGGFGFLGGADNLAYYYIGLSHTNPNLTIRSGSGHVGIGTISPSSKLEVVGDIKINSGTGGTSSKIFFKTGDNPDLSKYIGTESYWTVIGAHGNEGWKFKDNTGDVLMQINGLGGNNGFVGIGTSSPSAKLDVNGSFKSGNARFTGTYPIIADRGTVTGGFLWQDYHANNQLRWRVRSDINTYRFEFQNSSYQPTLSILQNGNVGIGTVTPSSELEVAGDIKIHSGTGGTSSKIIFKTSNDADLSKYIGTESYWTVIGAHGNEGWKFKDNTGDVLMQINGLGGNNGFVGIGTTTPKYKLSVNGTIGAEKIKVTADVDAIPDYVFEKNYDLMSLEETEKYITKEKHLPNIPSAKEIAKNNLDIGAMQMKLLEKIEELTLHVIQQNKRIKQLESLQ